MQGTWENGNFVLASTKNDEIQQLRNRVSELEADARRYNLMKSLDCTDVYSDYWTHKLNLHTTDYVDIDRELDAMENKNDN